jgi:hypothetical protein
MEMQPMFVRAHVCRCIAEFFHTAVTRFAGARAALALGLFAALFPVSVHASTKVPDWVRTAANQPLPKYPESTKAVVLFEDTDYVVGSDGKAVEHFRSVIKILRPQGRDYAYPSVWFDKDSKVNSMHVWSIDPAGHEYAVKDSEITERAAAGEGGILFDDEREKIADPPGRDPGGVIALEYTLTERPYLAETTWSFQGELPHLTQSFRLVLPPGYTYTTTWSNHLPVEAADLENHNYIWQMNNEPGIDLERVPMRPATDSVLGRMTIHYTGPGMTMPQDGTWQGIGEWYSALNSGRLASSPEIAAKAAELTQGKTDFYDKAEAIGEFVQKQIRYFDIEVGIGGYQPHYSAEIFHNRYGDCKDHAALLSTMLADVGIHSALMMVDTERGVVDPNDPSIQGDHMIGAIQIPDGYQSPKLRSVVTAKNGKRYLIFDPTWYETPFGQLEDNLQGSYGVLLEGVSSQVIQLPVLNPDLNRIDRSATFQLATDGSLKGSFTEKRFGDLAENTRYVLLHDDAKDLQNYFDNKVGRDLAAATVTGLTSQNADALNKDVSTSFDITAQHFASNAGSLLMVRPRVLGKIDIPVDHERRKFGIDLDETLQVHDDYNIQIPPGYVVDELPAPVKVDVGFASYESSTVAQGNVLHYTSVYTVRQVTLPADKYPVLQKLAGIIDDDEQGIAILRRSQ